MLSTRYPEGLAYTRATTREVLFFTFRFLLLLILVYPISPIIFHKYLSLKEQNYISPVLTNNKIIIRSDTMGDGHFLARRSGGRRKHKGIDIKGPKGHPVLAAKSGVVKAGYVKGGMGKYVKIFHSDGSVTVYGHLSEVVVKTDFWVWQGQQVGAVGKTGNANYRNMDPHVHFEVRVGEDRLDPEKLLGIKE